MTKFFQGSRGGIYYLDPSNKDKKIYLSSSQKKSLFDLVDKRNEFGKKISKKSTTKRTNPKLWSKVVAQVKRGSKGGLPGQWSARKAQLAVKIYKQKGGGYSSRRNSNNKLTKWTREDWGTKSGRNSVVGPRATRERYLPRKAREALSDKEYRQTSLKKRNSKGQYSKQPKKIAKKVKKYRK